MGGFYFALKPSNKVVPANLDKRLYHFAVVVLGDMDIIPVIFKSECVEDEAYLLTVIRYIHQNPIKASIVSRPEEYKWSSCAAYYIADRDSATFPDPSLILGIVHKEIKLAIKRLREFTEEGNEDSCLDCDETKRISESEAYEITRKIMKGKPVTALQTMDKDARNKILSSLRNDGLSLRQICRITGSTFHIVPKA